MVRRRSHYDISTSSDIRRLTVLFGRSADNEQRVQRQRREEQELQMVTERSKQEKTRQEGALIGDTDHLGYGLSQNMAPAASSSGSSGRASGSGTPEDSTSQPRKVIMQTNNPYASASEPTAALLPDRYIVDEPIDDAPPPVTVASSVPIGDKNPFGMYMKQKEESMAVPVPKEPSAKALGKLRRVSGQEGEAFRSSALIAYTDVAAPP